MFLKNGAIVIGAYNETISPKMREEDFRALSLGKESEMVSENEKWRTYCARGLDFYGKKCVLELNFKSGILVDLLVIPINTRYESWDDASLENMGKQKEENDEWLRTILRTTPPFDCKWGTITSSMDTKSLSAYISINYC